MRIAVTGAAGFVGSHVCEVLDYRGHEVVRLVRPDLDEWRALSYKIDACDAVCHCAWSGHPRNEVESQRNIFTSLTVAKAVGAAGVNHMVFMSSGGGIRGNTSYSTSKLEVESLLSQDFELFKFNLTILRPTAVYGPGQDPSKGLGAVITFLNAAMKNKPIHILGSPHSARDFLHVGDLAECTAEVIEQKVFGTFEVGGPETVSLNDLIFLINSLLSRQAVVQIENPTGVDPQTIQLNNTLITEATGWIPQRKLRNELLNLKGSLE